MSWEETYILYKPDEAKEFECEWLDGQTKQEKKKCDEFHKAKTHRIIRTYIIHMLYVSVKWNSTLPVRPCAL